LFNDWRKIGQSKILNIINTTPILDKFVIQGVNMTSLTDAIVEMREDDALEIVNERVKAAEDPLKIIEDCRGAMVTIGEKFEKQEYFLPDLIMSGEILREIMEIVEPKLSKGEDLKTRGKIVVGTVQGDVHDIGKNIVISLLKGNGFDVYDLGVDVPPQKFVEKVKEIKAEIVGLSGLLTTSYSGMRDTIHELKKNGLKNKVKVMIGGGGIDRSVTTYIGADDFGKTAIDAVKLCNKWIGGE